MLTVDDRIGSREFLRPLKLAGVPTRLKRLTFADFAFTGHGPHGLLRVGVERKTFDEILGAVTDSRFTGYQVPGLLDTYDHVWLLVEGAVKPDGAGIVLKGWPLTSKRGNEVVVFREAGFGATRHLYENVTKFQLTLQAKARLFRWPTGSAQESTLWLAALYRWYQKPWAAHKSAYTIDETKPEEAILERRGLKRRLAAQLPQVQWVRSRKVDRYFPTILAMMTADVRQWQRALGIQKGTKVAREIVRAIREPEAE